MNATKTELWKLGAGELADCIRKRSVSSREAVQAHLDRVAAVNPDVNAITQVLAETALAAAGAADAKLARGEPVGPLHGVPFTVKENIDVAGSATTWGAAALAGQVAGEDAPHIANLRAAGAIPIARTNMPDFALRWHTDSGVAGATRNPWDPALTPGGSSGGEAAALATGMTPLGVGNDLGGSLRWPAQCCGVSSLKPTLGRVPDAAVTIPTDPTMGISLFNVQGPLARRVADVRLAFGVMAAGSDRDPKFVQPVSPPATADRPTVAVVRDPGGLGIHPAVAAALDRAARSLAAAGYTLDEVEPPEIMACVDGWQALLAADFGVLEPLIGGLMSADTRTFFDAAAAAMPKPDLALVEGAFLNRHRLLREWAAFQRQHPLILAPIGTQPAPTAAADLEPGGAEAGLLRLRMTVAVNFLGLPAAAVAIPGELPQAVQMIGPRYREDLCLAAAEAIEGAVGAPEPIDPVTAGRSRG